MNGRDTYKVPEHQVSRDIFESLLAGLFVFCDEQDF